MVFSCKCWGRLLLRSLCVCILKIIIILLFFSILVNSGRICSCVSIVPHYLSLFQSTIVDYFEKHSILTITCLEVPSLFIIRELVESFLQNLPCLFLQCHRGRNHSFLLWRNLQLDILSHFQINNYYSSDKFERYGN